MDKETPAIAKTPLSPDVRRTLGLGHPDWVCTPTLAPPETLWQPGIDAEAGLTATARWYEAEHWL